MFIRAFNKVVDSCNRLRVVLNVKHCRLLENTRLNVTSAKQLLRHITIQTITPSNTPSSLALSNDGKSLVVTYHDDNMLYIYTVTGQQLRTSSASAIAWEATYTPRDNIFFAATVPALENAANAFAVIFFFLNRVCSLSLNTRTNGVISLRSSNACELASKFIDLKTTESSFKQFNHRCREKEYNS